MRRLLSGIVLLLIAGVALAQDTTLSQAYQSASSMTPPESDYSVAYLSQVFGTVGNVLQGTSGQVVGKMFEIFNKGVLVVAALWLTYTTITLVLNAAIQGSFGGQKNIAAILLRIAFGFALIIPSSTTGYSLLQDIFMKIVVQGVGLADKTWDKALDYLQHGGNLYIPPSNLNNDTNMVSVALGTPAANSSASPTLGYASQIFVNEVCMLENAQASGGGAATASTLAPIYSPPQQTATGWTAGTVSFPSSNSSSSGCGMATAYNTLPAGNISAQQTAELYSYGYAALKQAVISTLPAAKAYVRAANPYTGSAYNNTSTILTMANLVPPTAGSANFECPTEGSTPACSSSGTDICGSACSLVNSNSKAIFAAIVAYANLIMPYQNISQRNAGSYGFVDEAKAQGWIMAGGFYWSVEQTNTAAHGLSVSKLTPTVDGPTTTTINSFSSTVKNVITQSENDVVSYNTIVAHLWDQYVGAQQNNINAAGTSGGGGFANSMSSGSLGAFNEFSLGNANAYNPIATLMNEGNKILDAVVSIWILAIALSTGLAVAAGICMSTQPGSLILTTGLTWLKSIMMLITTLLLLPGSILAYYVPLYPFVVFTFAAIGWILMVVEGMAAAPLVCVGMTHPEGHDFLGKAEQALMLFLGIFLRPSLMVIGLVAAMVISFVAFSMLTSGFGTVLSSLMSTAHSALNNNFLVLISSCMVLIIFGMMTMELIEQCYKLIYQLPNAILQWIGGPQTGQDFGQMAQGVKGAVSAGAGAGKEFMQGADKAGDTLASSLQHGRERLEDKEGTGISGGGGGGAGGGGAGGGGAGGGTPPPAAP